MVSMRSRLLKALLCIQTLLAVILPVTAIESIASDPDSLVLTHRDLHQFELADIVLVSLLDGSLQARSRESGTVKWTLENTPLVDIQELSNVRPHKQPTAKASGGEMPITWLAEPSEGGGLYYFTPDGGIERIPATVWDLVQKAPFGVIGNIVYTGSRRTTLYAIDINTGEVLQAFGESLELPSMRAYVDPAGLLMIGRTEYTLDIHEHLGAPGWRIKIGQWTPNTRDGDLSMQYQDSLDSTYITPINDHTIMALAEDDMRPQRWIGETSSLLISVFDILRSKTNGQYSLVHQPPLNLSGVPNEWDLYVTQTPAEVPVIVRGARYTALLRSAPFADYCSGIGDSIFGAHPLRCQEKRRSMSNAPASISLLPPASTTNYPAYPRIDPPIVQATDEKGGSWAVTTRILENVGIVLVILALFAFCASRGWLPVDIMAGLQRLVGKASEAQQRNQDVRNGVAVEKGTINNTTPPAEEPKKRKRGARGGRRNNHNINNNNNTNNSNNTNNASNIVNDDSKEPRNSDRSEKDGQALIQSEPRQSTLGLTESPITISDTVLGYGSHGTTVFKGRFEGRDVAVKRMLLEFYDVASQEVDILRESDDHPNVVRYYCKYETDQFLYIALELCPGTLEDMVRETNQFSVMYDPLDSLRQVTLGLQHLHNLQVVHRDIKPQNILVALPTGKLKSRKVVMPTLSVRYLISDFGLCRKLEGEQSSFLPTYADSVAGTAGWAAPEMIHRDQNPELQTRLTKAVDIFSMGCLFYYVLSGGKHPFGDVHMRQVNIQQHAAPQLKFGGLVSPEAMDLIPRMLNFDPEKRPSTDKILTHPLFWTDQMKLDFLVKVSDRLEHESREEHSDLIDRLEVHSRTVVGDDWHTKFPQIFVDNLGKYRRYHGDRILDLLRAMRNKLHHYNDYSEELKACVGNLPGGYLRFFTSRFPNLLMTVFYYALTEFEHEDAFSSFFLNGGKLKGR